MAGSSATDQLVRADFSLRPVSAEYRATPPKSLVSRITWVRSSTQQVVTTSTTAITEQNIAPTVAFGLPQYAAWLSVFDQYYLDQFTVTIANNSPEGGTAACPQVFTAIDFDSSANLGSLASISNFSNCVVSTIAPGNSVTRVIRPCVSPTIGTINGAGVGRMWVDSSYNNVLFYAFRSIVNNTVAASVQLDYTLSYVWAFRNSI